MGRPVYIILQLKGPLVWIMNSMKVAQHDLSGLSICLGGQSNVSCVIMYPGHMRVTTLCETESSKFLHLT